MGSLSFSYGIEYFVKNFTESLNELFTVWHFPSGLSTAFSRCVGRFEKYRRCEQKKKALSRENDQAPQWHYAFRGARVRHSNSPPPNMDSSAMT